MNRPHETGESAAASKLNIVGARLSKRSGVVTTRTEAKRHLKPQLGGESFSTGRFDPITPLGPEKA